MSNFKKWLFVLFAVLISAFNVYADSAKQVDFLLSGYDDPTSHRPLSGGKVWTFLDGTSTLAPVWTDKDKGGVATNPVILDSAGKAEIYGDNIYKFVIYDSDDVLIEEINGLEYLSIIVGEVDTISDLRLKTGSFAGQNLQVNGYYTPADGGGGPIRVWVSDSPSGTYIDNGGSIIVPTGGDGSEAWLWIDDSVIDFRAFGFTGSGDETSILQTAIDAAPQGAKMTTGGKFSFSIDGLTVSEKSLKFDFCFSEISQTSSGPLLQANGSYSNQVAVSSITEVDNLSVITVVDAGGFSAGDVVKIVSTDEQPDFWVAGRHIGQFATVFDKTSTTLTLDRLIEDQGLYASNVNIAILSKNTVSVENLTVDGSNISDQAGTITFRDMIAPSVKNVIVKNTPDLIFNMVSCYTYTILDCIGINSEDSPGTGNLGYTVQDASSHGGFIDGLKSYGSRHAYTCNPHKSLGGVDMSCGYTTGTKIVNGEAYNAQSGAWDTHPGALDVQFINCSAFDCYSFGQSRSRGTKFINPYGYGLQFGIKFSSGTTGSTINPIRGNVITNPRLEVASDAFVEHYKNSGTNIALTDISDITVIGGRVRVINADDRGPILEARDVPVIFKIRDFYFETSSIGTDSLIFAQAVDGFDIEVKDVTLKADAGISDCSLIKFSADATALTHRVVAEDITFLGDGWVNRNTDVVTFANALVQNAKIESIGTGSFDAVNAGTRLTWGGEL